MLKLSDEQWERVRGHFSEASVPAGKPGRKPVTTRRVLEAVLWILNTGAQWPMLPQSYPNYRIVRRRFRQWCEQDVRRQALADLANELRSRGEIDEGEAFIDATFSSTTEGGNAARPVRRANGARIMAIVDRHGLPLSISTHAAHYHEVTLVQLSFGFYMIEAWPEHLVENGASDRDTPDAKLAGQGVHGVNRSWMLAPAPGQSKARDPK